MSNWMKANAEAEGITRAQAEQNFFTTLRPTSLLGPLHDDGGGREHRRLRLLGTGVRHHRRGAPRRRRRAAADRVSPRPRRVPGKGQYPAVPLLGDGSFARPVSAVLTGRVFRFL